MPFCFAFVLVYTSLSMYTCIKRSRLAVSIREILEKKQHIFNCYHGYKVGYHSLCWGFSTCYKESWIYNIGNCENGKIKEIHN